MFKTDLSRYYGSYKIGNEPQSLALHNQVTWNRIKASLSLGRTDFESLVEASWAHEHGDKSANHPYQFVTYCIKNGWLVLDNKSRFKEYLEKTSEAYSGKSGSYVQALNLLCEMIKVHPFDFSDCKNIWTITDVNRVNKLRELVRVQQKNKDKSPWMAIGLPGSYLSKGFCSAALTCYADFLEEQLYEGFLYGQLEDIQLPDDNLDQNIKFSGIEGKDALREVKVRCNQNVFRRVIRSIYNDACCITGLNIPQLNRASHIVAWSENNQSRLDPSNGLLLSATYDAAFDKHLISLDDEYCVILSKELEEYCCSDVYQDYFLSKKGAQISLPYRYFPDKKHLEEHRNLGDFY